MESTQIVLIILNVILITVTVLGFKRTKKILTDKKIISFTHCLDRNTVYTGLCVGNQFHVYDMTMTLFYKTYELKDAEKNFQDMRWLLINDLKN